MVSLEDQREAVVLQPLDQPVLPQRLGPVELLGGDPGGEQEQLLLAAGRGQRGVAHVVLEVEAGVVDPHRPPGLQRRRGQPLAVARDQVQATADVVEVVVERRRRALEDQQAADVHVRALALLVQERRVHRAEAIEVLLGHGGQE
jgi:hypothetical protein